MAVLHTHTRDVQQQGPNERRRTPTSTSGRALASPALMIDERKRRGERKECASMRIPAIERVRTWKGNRVMAFGGDSERWERWQRLITPFPHTPTPATPFQLTRYVSSQFFFFEKILHPSRAGGEGKGVGERRVGDLPS